MIGHMHMQQGIVTLTRMTSGLELKTGSTQYSRQRLNRRLMNGNKDKVSWSYWMPGRDRQLETYVSEGPSGLAKRALCGARFSGQSGT